MAVLTLSQSVHQQLPHVVVRRVDGRVGHSAAWAGWWNLEVATSTARPAAMGSTVRSVPSSTPVRMTFAISPINSLKWAATTDFASAASVR